MQCHDATNLIETRVIDGLAGQDHEALEEHLAVCASCRAELETYQALWTRLGEGRGAPPSDAARKRLADAVRRFEGEVVQKRSRPFRRWAAGVAAALALATGAVAGVGYERARTERAAAVTGPNTFLVLMRGLDLASSRDSLVGPGVQQWIGGLRDGERLVGGAAVADSAGVWLGVRPDALDFDGPFALDGYMLIQARDLGEARRFAAGSPHLAAGGAIELWPLR